MKITTNEMFKIILIIVVASILGYFFGFFMLFAHTAYEIFYYALFYGGMFFLYYLGSWIVTVFQEGKAPATS